MAGGRKASSEFLQLFLRDNANFDLDWIFLICEKLNILWARRLDFDVDEQNIDKCVSTCGKCIAVKRNTADLPVMLCNTTTSSTLTISPPAVALKYPTN